MEKLNQFRALMRDRGIDIYVVPTSDFHESEYVGDFFKCREFLTGFTGSAGIAVVTMDEAALFTDGRYFLQAEMQLQGSGFTLFKMGEKGVPTIEEFVKINLPNQGVIGFDGRVINAAMGKKFLAIAEEKNGYLFTTEDLVGVMWENRPEMAHTKAWILPEAYAGKSTPEKIQDIRDKMKEEGAALHLVTALDDIMWILNLRGDDVLYSPVILSYLIITPKGVLFYVQEDVISDEVEDYLRSCKVSIAKYAEIYDMADSLSQKHIGKILLDEGDVNYRIYEAVSKANEIVNKKNPSQLMKAKKNPVEVKNIVEAHVKDGVAMVRFIKWLKENVASGKLTEISAADQLEEIRKQGEHFVELSFDTIAGYGPHGAIIHYSATPETDVVLKPEGLLLVDSGAHYLEGSTDITRTIALGPVTEEEKKLFTIVLRSNLNLSAAVFKQAASNSLDVISRMPLWENGLDYNHGTGHGVGYLLNVHEGPNSIRYRIYPGTQEIKLEEGMVTTDEPGFYLAGKFGIRHENELLCVKKGENEYGEFYGFDVLTLCPFDLECVNTGELSTREKEILNAYHKRVYDILSPYLNNEEKLWLRYETREVQ